jgi:Rrf2 family protein
MSNSSRYTVAIHVLTLLAYGGQDAMTSEHIASSVNTNPVVIRRLLASLRAANLVSSQGGPGGGWRLLQSPQKITLREVYRVVEGSTLFPLHTSTPNPRCPVGSKIQPVLASHFKSAQVALEDDLDRTTIADLIGEVRIMGS